MWGGFIIVVKYSYSFMEHWNKLGLMRHNIGINSGLLVQTASVRHTVGVPKRSWPLLTHTFGPGVLRALYVVVFASEVGHC